VLFCGKLNHILAYYLSILQTKNTTSASNLFRLYWRSNSMWKSFETDAKIVFQSPLSNLFNTSTIFIATKT